MRCFTSTHSSFARAGALFLTLVAIVLLASACSSDASTPPVAQPPAVESGDVSNELLLATGVAQPIVTGLNHSCALVAGGTVKCWGANDAGQLGLGDTTTRGDGSGEMG